MPANRSPRPNTPHPAHPATPDAAARTGSPARARSKLLNAVLGILLIATLFYAAEAAVVVVGAATSGTGGTSGVGDTGPGSGNGQALVAGGLAVATDIPLLSAPPATWPPLTLTPAPVAVTFTCSASAQPRGDEPGVYVGTVCIRVGEPAADVPLLASYCPGQHPDTVGVRMDATGAQTTQWQFRPACAAPFTVTLVASGSDSSGHPYQGSTSFTVRRSA